MDLSYEADIDTRCAGCGDSAVGWAFAPDGTRRYVCADCAGAVERHTGPETETEAHPRADFCRACGRLTLARALTAQTQCPDCIGAAGERARTGTADADGAAPHADADAPARGGRAGVTGRERAAVAAAHADQQGAVDYDAEPDAEPDTDTDREG
jgi:predicted Fe-S protein YdhL (DUF1289 family)